MSTIDIKKIMDSADQLPLCSYFLETRKRAKYKSVLSWLSVCDEDTLKLITQSYANMIMAPHEKQNDLNVDGDIFDKEQEEQETYQDSFEEASFEFDQIPLKISDENDFIFLVMLLLSWESGQKDFEEEEVERAVNELPVFAATEILIREGLVKKTGKGIGKFFDDTKFIVTKKGKTNVKQKIKGKNDKNKSQ